VFHHGGVFTIEVFSYAIVEETCGAPDVMLIAVACDLINAFLSKHSFVLEMVQLSLVHVRSVVLWERARLRVYDLCATRTCIPSFRKMLLIL